MSKQDLILSLDAPLSQSPTDPHAHGQFGVSYHMDHDSWIVYNAKTHNCIAAIRLLEDKNVIRYREKSHWAPVIKEHHYDKETVHIPSLTLFRYSRWCKRMFQGFDFGLPPEGSKLEGQGIDPYKWAASKMFPEVFRYVSMPAVDRDTVISHQDAAGRWRDSRGRFVSAPVSRAAVEAAQTYSDHVDATVEETLRQELQRRREGRVYTSNFGGVQEFISARTSQATGVSLSESSLVELSSQFEATHNPDDSLTFYGSHGHINITDDGLIDPSEGNNE